MYSIFSTLLLIFAALLAPNIVHAQVANLIAGASAVVKGLVPIAYGLALVAFFWGVARYIFHAGSDDAHEEGRKTMVAGVVGLFVITAIWGIVAFLQAQFGFTQKTLTLPARTCATGIAVTFADILCKLEGYITSLLPIIAALTLAVFFWGVAKYIFNAGNEKAAESGRSIILWGITGLFVVLSVWGIVNFLAGGLGLGLTDGTGKIKLLPE